MASIKTKVTFPSGEEKIFTLPDSMRLTRNFTLAEMANKQASDDVKYVLSFEVLEFLSELQEFRDWFRKPMTVNGSYRTPSFNASCGGDARSVHLDARAVDWGITGHTEQQRKNVATKWQQICEKHGKIGGCNFYDWGYHLDDHEDKFGHKKFITRDYR